MKRKALASGIDLQSPQEPIAQARNSPPAGKGPIRTSVRAVRRALLLYFPAVLAIRTFEFCF